jgi:tetrathionate reductase subunit B
MVVIDPEKCTGMRNCVDACPYGVIYFNEDLNLAQKCTGCAHLLDQGWEVPRCVDACPTDALRFGEEEDFKELIADAEVLGAEYETRPRVYYLGLPKRFIAGAVYDPEADECLEGATVTLTNPETGEALTATTDVFGDFWFEQLVVGSYSLRVEKEGYLPKEVVDIRTEKDVNVGDIALYAVPVPA